MKYKEAFLNLQNKTANYQDKVEKKLNTLYNVIYETMYTIEARRDEISPDLKESIMGSLVSMKESCLNHK